MTVPSATYRLQLRREFGFDEVRRIAPYLADLGISHVYLSPVTTAVPGSTHGYDVVDPTHLNPDLGGEQSYRALQQELARLDMGQVIDVVPNHMGVAAENRWWMDVLRRGQASPYARVYDIDWEASGSGGEPRVLLPILGSRLDQVIADGEITLEVAEDDTPQLRYFDTTLPVTPESLSALDERARAALADPTSDDGRTAMRALLDAQHYRLEFWSEAKPRVNYRRFFVIDQLVGVRAEDPAVFGVTHTLALRLVSQEAVQGLRIDHVDGLADPAGYLDQLQQEVRAGHEASEAFDAPWIVVEKILARDEAIPDDWQCDGTTGYDFMRDVNGIFVDPAGEAAMTAAFAASTGEQQAYEDVAYQSRRSVTDGGLSGQLRTVSGGLYDTSGAVQRNIDRSTFDEALRALLASMEWYRTYHNGRRADPRARDQIERARDRASARLAPNASSALVFVAELLAQPPAASVPAIERLQQLMPTVQAKGVEDMAAYRYPRLLSLSEVGTSPGSFGLDVHEFHARNEERARRWPSGMLATATHDHKRGEDARARINVLAEVPAAFAEHLERWHRETAGVRPPAITRLDEYVTHQVLLGSWPAAGIEGQRDVFVQRVQDYLVKFGRETGVRTSWDAPDEDYESALRDYIEGLLDTTRSAGFLASRADFQERVSSLGVVQSLGQTVLKATSPGVPDTYQGADLWDLSLVDPDNRRAVAYDVRTRSLERMGALLDEPSKAGVRTLLESWRDGAVKQYVLATLLRARRARPDFWRAAGYIPLEVLGARARHIVAFARVAGEDAEIVTVARFPTSLTDGLWSPRWEDTRVAMPNGFQGRTLRDRLTGRRTAVQGELPARELLDVLPAAVARVV